MDRKFGIIPSINLLLTLGILIVISSTESTNIWGYNYDYRCQRYCYYNYGNEIYLLCCNYKEKNGFCPKGCLFKETSYALGRIMCRGDFDCPENHKCCEDNCSGIKKICKPALYETPVQEDAERNGGGAGEKEDVDKTEGNYPDLLDSYTGMKLKLKN